MNYYRRHIGDYLRDTSHLSLLEHGVYTRLLDVYYTSECPIQADQACRLIGARSKPEKDAVELILLEFFVLEGERWHQPRCNREIEAYAEKADRNREIGKLGGRPKKPKANPRETQTVSKSNPDETHSQEPIANSHKPVEKKEGAAYRLAVKPDAVPDAVWADFKALRKAKHAPVTATALDGIAVEAGRAGVGLSEALAICCKQGWQGFNAAWYANLQAQSDPRQQGPPLSRGSLAVHRLTGRSDKPQQEIIDVDATERPAPDTRRLG